MKPCPFILAVALLASGCGDDKDPEGFGLTPEQLCADWGSPGADPVAPPGARAVFRLVEREAGQRHLYAIRLSEEPFGCPVRVTPEPIRGENPPFWWADANTLLFWTKPGELYVVDMSGETPAAPIAIGEGQMWDSFAQVSPDGRWVAVRATLSGDTVGRRVYLVPLRDGVPGDPVKLESNDGELGYELISRVVWRPDSSGLVTFAGDGDIIYWVPIDEQGPGTPQRLPGLWGYEVLAWAPDGQSLALDWTEVYNDPVQLAVVEFAGGVPSSPRVVVDDSLSGFFEDVAWSPGSTRLLFELNPDAEDRSPSELYVVDVAAGSAAPQLLTGELTEHGYPPEKGWVDEDHALYSFARDDDAGSAYVVDVSSTPPGQPQPIMGERGRALAISPDRQVLAFADEVDGAYSPFIVPVSDLAAPVQVGQGLMGERPAVDLRFTSTSEWILFRNATTAGFLVSAIPVLGEPPEARSLTDVSGRILPGPGNRFVGFSRSVPPDEPTVPSQLSVVAESNEGDGLFAVNLLALPLGYDVTRAIWAPTPP